MSRLDWGNRKAVGMYNWLAVYLLKKSDGEWGCGNIGFATDRVFLSFGDMEYLMDGIADNAGCPRGNIVLLNLIKMADS
jgi:hypothetical protein